MQGGLSAIAELELVAISSCSFRASDMETQTHGRKEKNICIAQHMTPQTAY